MNFDLHLFQDMLQQEKVDGWLLADFRGGNAIANRVLARPPDRIGTRRWFYYIPARGEPVRICHRIEPHSLDGYPGRLVLYLSWQELHQALRSALEGARTVAMEYSPMNDIPYVSLVDAGTVELVRAVGVKVVSSANLVQFFDARWSDQEYEWHCQAARNLLAIKDAAFLHVKQALMDGRDLTEYDLQQFIWSRYADTGMVADHPPIVAVNAHASDPHYAPTATACDPIRAGDVLLIDIWAKLDRPNGIYADTTWMAYAGREVPEKVRELFSIVYGAQQSAFELIQERYRQGQPVYGWEADQAARDYISRHGYGTYFIHRTGHSIGTEVHGNGANLDNLETRDSRPLIPRTGFSIEPGIYLPEFGVRSELDVYIHPEEGPRITTAPYQREVIPLLAWEP